MLLGSGKEPEMSIYVWGNDNSPKAFPCKYDPEIIIYVWENDHLLETCFWVRKNAFEVWKNEWENDH